MEIKTMKVRDLIPYEKNPRSNEAAVEYVANSIKEFGFKVPIVIDKDNVIAAGHTRYEAAKKLGLKEVPCIIADDLTPEQIKAFRLADNKTSEKANWDYQLLKGEIEDILKLDELDLVDFGFGELELDVILNGGSFDETMEKESEQNLRPGGEMDLEEFSDEKFECQCPKCGFKFNRS